MSDRATARRRVVSRHLVGLGLAAVMLAGCAMPGQQGRPAAGESREQALLETLERMGRNNEARHAYAKAIEQYARLVDSDPRNEAYILGLARNLRYGGRPMDAVTVLRRTASAAGLSGRFAVRLELARALLAAGLTSDAQTAVDDLRRSAPNDGRVLGLIGLLADRAGRHDAAQAAYRAVLAQDPNDLRAANNLALSLALSGDLRQAIAMQERTVANTGATLQMRQNLALFYALDGQMDRAEAITRATLPEDAADSFIADLARLTGRQQP